MDDYDAAQREVLDLLAGRRDIESWIEDYFLAFEDDPAGGQI